ncbi:DNA mismatch repair protein Mlh1 [Macrosteles quadrilineatus]|uniref:DNA mismatch repair protein Mlh1 n=1 Tax=Macrosteles quadrilineatus TaxID=74068 RepID=UPI0023E27B2D|nr:DNA mismatch repair protein Mlh1 [Macrosteles quadrilineatus]
MSSRPVIKKLDETVVNRIAAGEVIQRPANAVKELLENSLDAKSTNIQITLKGGGLKLLQIQDNGCGIRKEDMEIVCERFTTSKLVQFEDLNSIATFGFRGEALASVSHVAHLTIITKTEDQPCAYKASYEDGKLKGAVKACAGNQGTQITVEDLFFNVSTRRKALKSPSEEHARVLDVVSRYAVHNPKVGFTLKKQGEGLVDLRTEPDSTHKDNIRIIYGNNITRELLEINTEDEGLQLKVNGYISNVNFSTKKPIFLLFINNRLVDSSAIRKSLDSVYGLYLPKGSHPFIYLSLFMNPRNLDVNVHPTKHEVNFLHEEAVIERIKKEVEKMLLGANTSRTFFTQARLPDLPEVIKANDKAPTVSANKLVRTDSTAQKLDKFFPSQSAKTVKSPDTPASSANRRDIQLTSVLSLRREVEEGVHMGLREIMSNHTFVGCVDRERALIQHETSLYMSNTRSLAEEMFYQIMLYEFANFGVIKFKEPLPLQELCQLALDSPQAGWEPSHGDKSQLASEAATLLSSRSDMLQDYFSLDINSNAALCAIPMLLVNYIPDLGQLPMYVLKLACDVNWNDEQLCFETFCRQTAKFYSKLPQAPLDEKSKGDDWAWTVEHVIYPTLKSSFLPPRKFAEDKTIMQVASLPELYKVFERC